MALHGRGEHAQEDGRERSVAARPAPARDITGSAPQYSAALKRANTQYIAKSDCRPGKANPLSHAATNGGWGLAAGPNLYGVYQVCFSGG